MNQKLNGEQICTRCVMDTTDPEITFNEEGICNHCINFEHNIKPDWFPNETGEKKLEAMIRVMQERTNKSDYSCIMGLSGGVDSSYLAYVMVKKFGIKPLVVHVDAGWNSELAVKNIETIVKILGLDLYTYVVDWEEMRDLQLAFLKASVANQDVPQDHAYATTLSNVAAKYNIKYILSGGNYATESILPSAWGYNAMDATLLLSIHKAHGNLSKLKTYPVGGFVKRYMINPFFKKIKVLRPLNYMPYDKTHAMEVLTNELEWRYYGSKHYESRFTKFFQSYYLPKKFGYDKRRAHLSSLIVSGQMSREEALLELEKPPYDSIEIQNDKEFIARKLGISLTEFENIIKLPNKSYKDYPNGEWKFNIGKSVKKVIQSLT